MCYVTFMSISTTQILPEPSALLRVLPVEMASDYISEAPWDEFAFENVYYIGSSSGCSCKFRYWSSGFYFAPAQDWASERPDDESLIATRILAGWIRKVTEAGATAQIIVHWYGEAPLTETAVVDMAKIADEEFYIMTDKIINIVSSQQGAQPDAFSAPDL